MVMASEIKNTMRSRGTFSTPSILGSGDPFDDKAGSSKDPRLKGMRNFLSGPVPETSQKGFQRLFEGEKWASEFERTRKFAGEEKKKNLTDHGFRYTSYPKKSSGLGNYYGTIGGRHLHEGEKEAKAPPAAPAELEPRQVQTMPAKKGRFNTPGISFGCPQPKGVAHKLGKEFEYQSDPYNTARKLEMEMRAASKKARQPQPFKSMSRSADYFDETKTGIASRVYEAVAMPALKEAPPPPARASDKPFYPSKPAKSGSAGMLNKFPAHMEDPESEKFKKELERKQAERAFGSWHYQEWGKTAPTRSVLFHHPGTSTLD